jgi:hypothetical protein
VSPGKSIFISGNLFYLLAKRFNLAIHLISGNLFYLLEKRFNLAIHLISGNLFYLLAKRFNLAIHFTSGNLFYLLATRHLTWQFILSLAICFIFWQIVLTWPFVLSWQFVVSSGVYLLAMRFTFVYGRFLFMLWVNSSL